MALLAAAGDAAGHRLDALHIGHRGATKFLNQQGHGGAAAVDVCKQRLIIRLGVWSWSLGLVSGWLWDWACGGFSWRPVREFVQLYNLKEQTLKQYKLKEHGCPEDCWAQLGSVLRS